MTNDKEPERGPFEAWADAAGFNIHRDENEKYTDYHRTTTRWAWEAWQARAALAATPQPAIPPGFKVVPVEQIEATIEAMYRAAWTWGESCGVDGVGFNESGDSHNNWMRNLAAKAKDAVYLLLSAAPVPEAGQGVSDEQPPVFPEGWKSAAVTPPASGWYERRYSDGTYAHHWSGSQWSSTKDGGAHWRQLADAPYPLWRPIPLDTRALLSPAPAQAQAPVEVSGPYMPVAEVTEAGHDDLEARIRWLFNPMPEGSTLYEQTSPPPQSAQLIEPASSHICDTCKRPAHLGRCADVGDTAWAPLMEGKDAARYRWLRENHAVTLITIWYGNGCVNKTIEMAEEKLDAALSQGQQTEQGSRNG